MEVTQELVDLSYMEAKREWNRLLKASGQSQLMFVAVSSEATDFLYQYKTVQDRVRELGFKMPNLVSNIEVREVERIKIHDSEIDELFLGIDS